MVNGKLHLKKEIEIPVDSVKLVGELTIPKGANGIIVFSHGSGSSRLSPRNKFVATKLQKEGLATLLVDLLTFEEDQDPHKRFDIELLTQRLILITEWLKENETKELGLGYFGSSTGAASALAASSLLGDIVQAVVSRGGRPDLATPYLPEVKAPTLLIVGSLDYSVIQFNDQAFSLLNSEKKMVEILNATHLFEEPGKLEEVAYHAGSWFKKHLKKKRWENMYKDRTQRKKHL